MDEDMLRSVDAFSEDDGDRGGIFELSEDTLGASMDQRMVFKSNALLKLSMDSSSKRTLADRCLTVSDFMNKRTSLFSKDRPSAPSNVGRTQSRTLSRTEIKLLENSDQPTKGMLFYILYTLLYSLCFLCASYLYRRNPDLTPFQMLVMRSAFALAFQVIWVNKELKSAVWDGVDRKSVPPLIFRSIQGTATNIINYSVTKFLPLTLIAIVNNMGPLVTVVLAFFILKERIKTFEIVMILLTVGGVLTVVIGESPDAAAADGRP